MRVYFGIGFMGTVNTRAKALACRCSVYALISRHCYRILAPAICTVHFMLRIIGQRYPAIPGSGITLIQILIQHNVNSRPSRKTRPRVVFRIGPEISVIVPYEFTRKAVFEYIGRNIGQYVLGLHGIDHMFQAGCIFVICIRMSLSFAEIRLFDKPSLLVIIAALSQACPVVGVFGNTAQHPSVKSSIKIQILLVMVVHICGCPV